MELWRQYRFTLAVIAVIGLMLQSPLHGRDASSTGAQAATATVALTLDCPPSGHVRCHIANTGSTDTALVLGVVLGNGKTYMVQGVRLTLTTPGKPPMDADYRPKAYPAAIAGTVAEWAEGLPAAGTFSMSAVPDDFMTRSSRLQTIPPGTELQMQWTIPAPRPELMLLTYWNGTAKSNRCTVPARNAAGFRR
ncbi:hypothetical protein BH18ACI5_BH18ACI5_02540 [soil metagenome]